MRSLRCSIGICTWPHNMNNVISSNWIVDFDSDFARLSCVNKIVSIITSKSIFEFLSHNCLAGNRVFDFNQELLDLCKIVIKKFIDIKVLLIPHTKRLCEICYQIRKLLNCVGSIEDPSILNCLRSESANSYLRIQESFWNFNCWRIEVAKILGLGIRDPFRA